MHYTLEMQSIKFDVLISYLKFHALKKKYQKSYVTLLLRPEEDENKGQARHAQPLVDLIFMFLDETTRRAKKKAPHNTPIADPI